MRPPEIRSGQFDGNGSVRHYRSEQIGDILIERVIWGDHEPLVRYGAAIGGPGYVWFRFWLPRLAQVVERYYDPDGGLAGTLMDICMPIHWDATGYRAADLVLDLWLAPDGRVTLYNEAAFEQAVRDSSLMPEEASHAETHLRDLTAAMAQDRFPPPIVRNWQLDMDRVRASELERVANGEEEL